MSDAALRELAARAASGDGPARRELSGQARAQARDILAQGRFHDGRHHDGPLHGFFVRIGDWLESLLGRLPGGTVSGWVLLVLLAAAVAALVATLVRRRQRAWEVAPAGVREDDRVAGPDELERRAGDAERAGDLDTGVRLRFAAGLLRLDRAQAIELRPSLTSGEVGRALRSADYDAVARTHDAVTYGGRRADDEDAAQARTAWPAIVGEARRR